MGLSGSSGSLHTHNHRPPNNACFTTPPSEVSEVVPKVIDLDPNSVLDKMSYINDSMLAGNTAPESSQIVKDLAAYAEGINISVTYYHQLNNTTYQMTSATDFSESIDPVHLSFLKINGFQLKLQDALEFNYTTDATTSQVVGDAIVYPFFSPNVGDLFLYTVSPGRVGLFRVYEAPTRLTINAETYHKIRFILDRIFTTTTDPIIQKLDQCVARNTYFNLKRFVTDNGALLSTDEHTTITAATGAINTLTHYYGDEFYDNQVYRSFIDTPDLYDPYLVEFAKSVMDLGMLPGYPTQLRSNPIHWRRTFWFKLLYPAHTPDEVLINKCFRVVQTATYRTVGINALTNRCFIAVEPRGIHPYPPFNLPAEYDATVQTLPMQIKLYFEQQKIRPTILLDIAKGVLTYSRRAQFYYIPIIIFLLKQTIRALTLGHDIILGVPSGQEPTDNSGGCANCVYRAAPSHALGGCIPATCRDTYIPGCGGSVADDCVPCPIHGDLTEADLDKRCHWHLQHTHHHRSNTPVCVTDELDIIEE